MTPLFARKKEIKLRGKFLHHSKHHTMARMLREFIFSLRELLPDMATLDSFHCAWVLMLFLYLLHLYPDFMCMTRMTIRLIPSYILRIGQLGPDQTHGPYSGNTLGDHIHIRWRQTWKKLICVRTLILGVEGLQIHKVSKHIKVHEIAKMDWLWIIKQICRYWWVKTERK